MGFEFGLPGPKILHLFWKGFYPEALRNNPKQIQNIFFLTSLLNTHRAWGNAFQQVTGWNQVTSGWPDSFSALDSTAWENSCLGMRAWNRRQSLEISFWWRGKWATIFWSCCLSLITTKSLTHWCHQIQLFRSQCGLMQSLLPHSPSMCCLPSINPIFYISVV